MRIFYSNHAPCGKTEVANPDKERIDLIGLFDLDPIMVSQPRQAFQMALTPAKAVAPWMTSKHAAGASPSLSDMDDCVCANP